MDVDIKQINNEVYLFYSDYLNSQDKQGFKDRAKDIYDSYVSITVLPDDLRNAIGNIMWIAYPDIPEIRKVSIDDMKKIKEKLRIFNE